MSSQMSESTRLNVTSCVLSGGSLFEYTKPANKLDIRFLQLEHSISWPRQGMIKGKLKHVALDDFVNGNNPLRYFAISYCWGDPVPTDRIWLSEDAHLPINASAADLLRNIDGEQDIWIDSVCINQGDNDEKSRQVMMMWGTYKFAVRAIVWLGGPEDNAKLAMYLIFDGANPSRIDSVWLPTDGRAGFPFRFDALAWGALAKLLDRP